MHFSIAGNDSAANFGLGRIVERLKSELFYHEHKTGTPILL
jgi:hypothetical protein